MIDVRLPGAEVELDGVSTTRLRFAGGVGFGIIGDLLAGIFVMDRGEAPGILGCRGDAARCVGLAGSGLASKRPAEPIKLASWGWLTAPRSLRPTVLVALVNCAAAARNDPTLLTL